MSIPTRLFVVEKSQISAAVAEALAERSIVESNDPRLSDARTPTDGSVTNAKVAANAAIAESKLALASDAAAGTASRRTLGTGANQAAAGNDSRLTNARPPTAHGHPATEITNAPAGNIAATTVQAAINELDTEKQPAGSYVASNDPRLSDPRTPTAHKAMHATGGSDALTPADIGAATSGHLHDSRYPRTVNGVPPDVNGDIAVAGGGGGASLSVQDEGAGLTSRSVLNFTGSGVTAADDSANGRTNVTVNAPASATDAAQGIVELATATEVQTGTDTVRAITPAGLASRSATTSRTGLSELATDTEVQTGTDTLRTITPSGLTSRTATDSRTGLVEHATTTELAAATSGNLVPTAATLKVELDRRGALAFVKRAANQSVPNNTWTMISWDTETSDAPGWFTSASPTRITVAENGVYMILALQAWELSTSGYRTVRVCINGQEANTVARDTVDADSSARGIGMLSGVAMLTAGQYLTIEVLQNSGATRTFGDTSDSLVPVPYFCVRRIG